MRILLCLAIAATGADPKFHTDGSLALGGPHPSFSNLTKGSIPWLSFP